MPEIGVDHAIAFPGLNPLQFTNTPNTGTVFLTLKPFGQRSHRRCQEDGRGHLNMPRWLCS